MGDDSSPRPGDRPAKIAPACRIHRARVFDAGRIITQGAIASGMKAGFHLPRRASQWEIFIAEAARVMTCHEARGKYRTGRDIVDPSQ